MSSRSQGHVGNIIDRYLTCGCGGKSKKYDFEIVNMDDVPPQAQHSSSANPIVTSDESLTSGKSLPKDAVSAGVSYSTLDQYYVRSLTNKASLKSSLDLIRDMDEQRQLSLYSQSGPNLSEASRPLSQQRVDQRPVASEGSIPSTHSYSLREQIEAYKNIWKYDSTKEYYYEDIKATGALLLDLPPEMLINLKYREVPFDKKSSEEAVKKFLAEVVDESVISESENTQMLSAPELIAI